MRSLPGVCGRLRELFGEGAGFGDGNDSRAACRGADPCPRRRVSWRSRPGRRSGSRAMTARSSPAHRCRWPRNSEPKMMSSFCSARSASRKAARALDAGEVGVVRRRGSGLRRRNRPRECAGNALACRRSLMSHSVHEEERGMRSAGRWCAAFQASTGCCSVGSLPRSRMAGAVPGVAQGSSAIAFAGDARGRRLT